MERELRKGGANLTYIPVSEVITRLNKVLGVDKWSFDIVSCQRDSRDPDYIVAHVRITWHTSENVGWISRDGFGGQKIKRTKQGDIVDLGDEFKGAVSDALKKAAQTLGVGLYLSRSEEAIEIEEFIAASQSVESDSELMQKWDNFIGLVKSLNADQKAKLNTHWDAYAGGRAKPTKSTATHDDLDELIAAIVKISFEAADNNDE
jgi:hypothetical protein